MKKNNVLVNFAVSKDIKIQFDRYCQILGATRSKILNDMIEDFILSNEELVAMKLAKNMQLNEVTKKSSRIVRFRDFIEDEARDSEGEEPPRFFISEHD